LASDLSLALVRRLQERGRGGFAVDCDVGDVGYEVVAEYLSAPTLEAHGRAFPVDIRYLDKRRRRSSGGKLRFGGSASVPVWELAAEAAGM